MDESEEVGWRRGSVWVSTGLQYPACRITINSSLWKPVVVANLLDCANSSVSRKNASVYPVLALTRVVRERELVNLRRIPRIVGKYSCPYSIWWLYRL